jgi:hypothetical protein
MTLRLACVVIAMIIITLPVLGQSVPSPKRNNPASAATSQGDDPYVLYNQCITDANTAMNQCVDSGKNPLLVCKPAENAQVAECEKKFDHSDNHDNGSSSRAGSLVFKRRLQPR